LVVDDEVTVAKVFKVLLESEGHEVSVAADGNAGLRAFHDFEPDVIVLDWMMPHMTGLELLERIKSSGQRAKTRIVLLTAKVQETDMLRAWQAGIDEYLTKPVSEDKLLESIDWVLKADPTALEKRRRQEMERSKLLRTLDDLDDY